MNCYKIIQRQHCIKLLTGPIRKICPTSIEAVWRARLFPDSNLPTLIGINSWTHVLCPNLYSRTDQEGTGLCRMHQCNVQWSPQMGRQTGQITPTSQECHSLSTSPPVRSSRTPECNLCSALLLAYGLCA